VARLYGIRPSTVIASAFAASGRRRLRVPDQVVEAEERPATEDVDPDAFDGLAADAHRPVHQHRVGAGREVRQLRDVQSRGQVRRGRLEIVHRRLLLRLCGGLVRRDRDDDLEHVRVPAP
jgi:hypothetical protein